MLAALTACMAANIVTVDEGLGGFANEGVLTVLVSRDATTASVPGSAAHSLRRVRRGRSRGARLTPPRSDPPPICRSSLSSRRGFS